MINVACKSRLHSVVRSSCIHTQKTGWQSGVQSYIMPRLPEHLVQELNVGTVAFIQITSNKTRVLVIFYHYYFVPCSYGKTRYSFNILRLLWPFILF